MPLDGSNEKGHYCLTEALCKATESCQCPTDTAGHGEELHYPHHLIMYFNIFIPGCLECGFPDNAEDANLRCLECPNDMFLVKPGNFTATYAVCFY